MVPGLSFKQESFVKPCINKNINERARINKPKFFKKLI